MISSVCIITFATCSDIMSDQLKVWSAMARSKVNNDYDVMTIKLFLQHRLAWRLQLSYYVVVEATALLFVQQHEMFTL